MMDVRFWVVVGAAIALVAGCSDDARGTFDTPVEDAGWQPEDVDAADLTKSDDASPPGDAFAVDVTWRECEPVRFQNRQHPAQCADVEVPLDWNQPDGESLTLFVKRAMSQNPDARNIWLVPGGPGFGANIMEYSALELLEKAGAMNVYLLDHRGTARSQRLGCSQEALDSPAGPGLTEDELPECLGEVGAVWGAGIRHLSARQAATDLGRLIDAVHTDDEQVFVYGVSYGAYLLHRYLQQFPEQPSGVIFDSICTPGACDLSRQDLWFDEAGRALLDECAGDPTCSEKLGPDPWAALEQLHEDIGAGRCFPEDTQEARDQNRQTLRVLLGEMLRNRQLRPFVAAVIYRGLRCTPEDVGAISNAVSVVLQGGQAAPINSIVVDPPEGLELAQSGMLGAYISVSEMWAQPRPPVSEMVARQQSTLMAPGYALGMAQFAEQFATELPLYDPEPGYDELADYDGPALMLQAAVDPATPLSVATPTFEHFDGPNQTAVVLPYAAHGTIHASPMIRDATMHCGFNIMTRFLARPSEPPPTGCAEVTLPIDYRDSAISSVIFGTQTLWGDR